MEKDELEVALKMRYRNCWEHNAIKMAKEATQLNRMANLAYN